MGTTKYISVTVETHSGGLNINLPKCEEWRASFVLDIVPHVRSVEKSDRKIAAKMQTDTLLSFHGAATIIKWRDYTSMSGEYRSVVSCDYRRLSP
jgi:hypothetical protein